MKKPLEFMVSVYRNSENAIAVTGRLLVLQGSAIRDALVEIVANYAPLSRDDPSYNRQNCTWRARKCDLGSNHRGKPQ